MKVGQNQATLKMIHRIELLGKTRTDVDWDVQSSVQFCLLFILSVLVLIHQLSFMAVVSCQVTSRGVH